MQRSGANLRLTLAILSLCSSLPVMAQNQPSTPQSASVNNTLRQLVGQSPGHAISYYNLALEAYQKGALESAIIFFRRATDLDPNLSDAQYNLGVLYQSQKRAKEAIPRFEEVLRVKPTDADAHYQLGLALMDMGRAADAKTHFAAIAPNSQHFADAQKRTQMCDAQLAGATIAVPTYSPTVQPQAQQQPSQQPVRAGYNPLPPVDLSNNPPGSNPGYQTGYGAQSQPVVQPYQQPQTYSNQTAYKASPEYATAGQPKQIASAAVPKSQGNLPTAVLANSSVRVIATGFSAPSGLTFDRMGNLYVANFNSNTVDRISADGTRTQFASGANLKGPIGLACDESGNIYVANYNGGTVARITPAGISTIIGTNFKQPYYLTVDKGGNLFVTQQEDNSIVRITLPRSVVSKN